MQNVASRTDTAGTLLLDPIMTRNDFSSPLPFSNSKTGQMPAEACPTSARRCLAMPARRLRQADRAYKGEYAETCGSPQLS